MRLTEQHFEDLAEAAQMAYDHGEEDLAARLDIMARKANLECTRAACPFSPMGAPQSVPRLTWRDMPSTIIYET